MIEFTDDQKKAIAAAQEKFTDLKDKVDSGDIFVNQKRAVSYTHLTLPTNREV